MEVQGCLGQGGASTTEILYFLGSPALAVEFSLSDHPAAATTPFPFQPEAAFLYFLWPSSWPAESPSETLIRPRTWLQCQEHFSLIHQMFIGLSACAGAWVGVCVHAQPRMETPGDTQPAVVSATGNCSLDSWLVTYSGG